jgi:Flp pilus assembly protein CpaB
MKKLLPIIVALLLAAIASLGIVKWAKESSRSGEQLRVIVAARDLKVGDKLIQSSMASTSIRYPSQGQERAFWQFVFDDYTNPNNMAQLEGRTLGREVKTGQPLLESSLRPVKTIRSAVDWKDGIELSKRAISVPLEDIASVSGLIQVGDFVDVFVTLLVPEKDTGPEKKITMPVQMGQGTGSIEIPYSNPKKGEPMTFCLLQNVKLLAVGSDTAKPEDIDWALDDPFAALTKKSKAKGAVTLAVTPEEAVVFAFTTSNDTAKFVLALRRPGDEHVIDDLKAADLESVLETVGAW